MLRTLGAPLLVAWIAIVLAGYYAVHKPLPAGEFSAWGLLAQPLVGTPLLGAAWDLGAAGWLTAMSWGIGRTVLRHVGADAPLPFALGLGFGVLGLAFLALGVIGFLAPVPAFFLLGLGSGVVIREAKRQGTSPRRTGGAADRLHLAFALLIGITAILTATRALTPSLAWDALVYHLTGPKRYAEAGAIVGGIDIPHLYFPSLMEQLFTAALLGRGDVAAQLLHFALAGTGVLAVFAFLDRREGRRAAWLGAALLGSVPSLVSLARIPYVEWGLITFGLLSFWAMREALDSRSERWLLLSGVFAGLAVGTKYTGVFLVLGLAVALVWETRRLRPLVSWGAVGAVVAAPWFLRNLVHTDNPVYPFAFGGWNWDSWKADWFSRAGTGLLNEPWRLLIAPVDLTIHSVEGGGAYDVDLGPLLLALTPVVLGGARHIAGWGASALVVVVVGYVAWLIGAAQSSLLLQGRLLLPVLPFLACLIATALARPGMRFARVLHATVLIGLVLAVAGYAFRWAADPPLPYLLRTETREAYIERHLGDHYRAIDFVNSQNGRTLFLWEPRSYYCSGECQPDGLLFNWRYLLHRHGNADGAAAAMKADGYTHLLVHVGGMRFFAQGPRPEVEPEHIEAFGQLESRYLERLYGDLSESYAVYRLR